jgi:hypothetical protein
MNAGIDSNPVVVTSKKTLDRIYRMNIQRFAGRTPHKLNKKLSLKECELRRSLVEKHPFRQRLLPELDKIIRGIKNT